jgi:protein-disulfide isomerase
VPKARSPLFVRLGAVTLAAIVAVVALVLVSQGGSSGGDGGPAKPGRFAAIPQQGLMLGKPDAPLTMVEFADLQCPFCAQYDRDVLPTLLKRYVRTGKLRLELRPLAFIGPDSVRMASVVVAAAEQGRAWQLVDLIYHNQGRENSGYATEEYLREQMAKVPGLDAGAAIGDSSSAAVARQLRSAQTAATQAGVDSTPSFLLGPTGGRLERLSPSALEPDAFTGPIDQQLR